MVMAQTHPPEELLEVRVYTAEPEIRRPGQLLRRMLTDLVSARSVALEMARRNIAAQYRQSFSGILLAFCPALVVTVWCTMVQHARVINVEALAVPYPAFVLISMMLWLTFTEALQAPIEGLGQELYLLARAKVPPETIVLAKLAEVGFQFGIKLILIVGAIIWFGLPVRFTVWLAPLPLCALIALGLGLGLILAPLNALYQDISKALPAVTTFWLFLTPVLFPIPTEGAAAVVVRLNPVTPLLSATREWITLGEVGDPLGLAVAVTIALGLLWGGWVFYRVSLPVIIDRTNA
jgi:lipopolysaccharide transport system permease protein